MDDYIGDFKDVDDEITIDEPEESMLPTEMELAKFDFPKPSWGLPTNNDLLAEAKKRGFLHGRTPYNKLFSELFFKGGKVEFKDGVDENLKQKGWDYCRALMGSFNPKHEHKEAVCAMLLSEIVEVAQ